MPSLIEIVPAQPSWRTDFETLKIAVLRAAPAGSRVHHIGSTAVPGLAAKDIIDIQLRRGRERRTRPACSRSSLVTQLERGRARRPCPALPPPRTRRR